MGCGASSQSEPPSRQGSADPHGKKPPNDFVNDNDDDEATKQTNNPPKQANPSQDDARKDKNKTNKSNKISPVSPANPKPVPKAISFDINLDNDIDKILCKKPPKRLRGLEPLSNVPKLTAEALQEKIKLAEKNREKQLQKKKAASRKSRMRRKMSEVRNMDDITKKQETMEEKLKSAEKNREAQLREAELKQKQREERARRAREKALRMKEGDADLPMDIEGDDASGDDGVEDEGEESWLEDHNGSAARDLWSGGTDRVYSGRSSPQKAVKQPRPTASAVSSSTTDSFDYAFQRRPSQKDQFFDT